MNKKIVIGLVLFLSIILIFSSGFSGAFERNHLFKSDEKNNERSNLLDNQELNARSLLKNLFFGHSQQSKPALNFFTSSISTVCNGIEKNSEIQFGSFNEIDVDNNENTGINGKDIRIQYLILPYILTSPELSLGAIFSVGVERIGEEIKDSSFLMSATIANNLISVGYESPEDENNEIPKHIQLSSAIFIELSDGAIGFTMNMNPTYESNQEEKKISLFAGFDDSNVKRSYSFGFQPASETQITIRSTLEVNKWEYTFTRDTPYDTTFTAEMTKTVDDITKETKLTLDSLPEEISFTLSLTPFSSEGGSIEYQSVTMYDINVLVETAELGQCKYALIKNTPRALSAEWIPSKENGFYHINLDSEETTVYLLNSLDIPTINISINDLSTVDMNVFWNLTNPGDINVVKDSSLHVDLDILLDDRMVELDAEPTAENIYCSWKSNVSGYFSLDTNQDPLSNIDLLIIGPDSGVNLSGETLAADDFLLEWTIWPLSELTVNKTGSLDFFSISIDIFVNEQWYHLWPWF